MTVEIQAYGTNLYAALNVSEVFRCLFGGEAYLSHWDIFQRKTSLEIYREREKKKNTPYFLLTAEIMIVEVELSLIAFFSACTQCTTASIKTTCFCSTSTCKDQIARSSSQSQV